MLGMRREPIRFRILKPVMGIDSRRYMNAILETRSVKEIAMLNRLRNDHALNLDDEDAVPFEEPEPLEPQNYEDLPWPVILSKVNDLGEFYAGITKKECIMILRENSAAPEDNHEEE